jgi:hypothetical protein
MAASASRQATVEHFHLQFCRLFMSGPDRTTFAIKGGCNLRFFFESIRYSEDIDIDVVGHIADHVLRDRVTKTLRSQPLASVLQSRGIRIERVTAPKQTETTQRWKVELAVQGHAFPLHTKIEFSRRPQRDAAVVERISLGLARMQGVVPFVAAHYPVPAAVRQKVRALVGRAATQTRDVFDLATLFARPGGDATTLPPVKDMLPAAIDLVASLTYAQYKSQVVGYLVPDQASAYSTPEAWETIQLDVITVLEGGL